MTKSLDEILNGGLEGKDKKEPVLKLTDEHKSMIRALIANKQRLKFDQEAIRDDTKAIADALGRKAGDINRLVSIIIAEEEKGGAVKEQNDLLELAEQVLEHGKE
jgi:hypothetical protein